MKTGAKILVIDDEKSIRRFMDASLTAKGYEVMLAKTGQEGVKTAAENHPDIIILDLNLPDKDGLTVLKEIRKFSRVPVIVLTVKSADADKELLLDSGADDYLIKPFSLTELLARIRVALRHSINLQEDTTFKHGPLEVDFGKRKVFIAEEEVHLTATEFNLLKALVSHAGKIVTQSHLLSEVWGPHAVEQSHYLRIYVSQLRRKLEDKNPSLRGFIITDPGVGYRINL
ncbi:MAG: DNA-binding response regulator [Elusimicrobia bacterium RIFOXYA12_FULL_51_18]|nr:MAG: DNA-binding response regulator [Elusimicrobia bacterium RIFOXYA12_FULL_51_18]OGS28589.1 MAG: DNA-binding response regulator [Elusimicrobia bacterium RIFOXYA2_FULL_53_38]